MDVRACFFHLFTDSCKFGSSAFSGILFFQEEGRLLGKRRTVLPDLVDQVFGIVDLDVLWCQSLFKFLALAHGHDTSVKTDGSAFRNNICQKFCDGRGVAYKHLHQTDAAAFQFVCRLEEVTSVGPQTTVILCDDCGSVRSAEPADEFSCLKVFADILALMKISGGDHIGVHAFLSHESTELLYSFCCTHIERPPYVNIVYE